MDETDLARAEREVRHLHASAAWTVVAGDPSRAFESDSPRLRDLVAAFGEAMSAGARESR
jgi:hypothetical protein